MKTAKEYFQDLIYIAEEIIGYYNMLMQYEFNEGIESSNYKSSLAMLCDALSRENSIYLEAQSLGLIDEIRHIVRKETKALYNQDISFLNGFSHLHRLNCLIESLVKSDTLDYVYALKYDINRILLSFIEMMITNPYYENVRADLIQYKYSLVAFNIHCENDLINGDDISSLNVLSAPNYREKCYSYQYVDKALIELPYLKAMEYLSELSSEDNLEVKRATIIIKIINILARLTLGDEGLVSKYYEDSMTLLDSEMYPEEIVKIAEEMFQIFSKIQSKIGNGRK